MYRHLITFTLLLPAFAIANSGAMQVPSWSPDGTGTAVPYDTMLRKWHEIPRLEDFGTGTPVLAAGGYGLDWDGQIESVIGQVELNGSLYLYYVGSQEYDEAEGTPAWRAIGVAISTDGGQSYTKYAGNPVITHLPTPNLEEGATSAALLVVDGALHVWYGANTWAGGSEVDTAIRHCRSTDGVTFTDDTLVSGGPGHERLPYGAFHDGEQYYVYYTHIDGPGGGAGGKGPVRMLSGPDPAAVSNDTLIPTSADYTHVPVTRISDDLLIMTAFRNSAPRLVDVFWIDPAVPGILKGPIRNWYDGDPTIKFVPYYDPTTGSWQIFEHQWEKNGEIWRYDVGLSEFGEHTN
jgi:hypothetical protein